MLFVSTRSPISTSSLEIRMSPEAILFITSVKVREMATNKNEMMAIVKVGEMNMSNENINTIQIIFTTREKVYLKIRDFTIVLDNPINIVLIK